MVPRLTARAALQYLMFYICSLGLEFTEGFLQATIDAVREPSTPINMRLACAAHLSSFVGRAGFIPVETVKAMLEDLGELRHCLSLLAVEAFLRSKDSAFRSRPACPAVRWAHTYIDSQDKDAVFTSAAVQQHPVFFAVGQTICYIACYRHRAIIEIDGGLSWM